MAAGQRGWSQGTGWVPRGGRWGWRWGAVPVVAPLHRWHPATPQRAQLHRLRVRAEQGPAAPQGSSRCFTGDILGSLLFYPCPIQRSKPSDRSACLALGATSCRRQAWSRAYLLSREQEQPLPWASGQTHTSFPTQFFYCRKNLSTAIFSSHKKTQFLMNYYNFYQTDGNKQ